MTRISPLEASCDIPMTLTGLGFHPSFLNTTRKQLSFSVNSVTGFAYDPVIILGVHILSLCLLKVRSISLSLPLSSSSSPPLSPIFLWWGCHYIFVFLYHFKSICTVRKQHQKLPNTYWGKTGHLIFRIIFSFPPRYMKYGECYFLIFVGPHVCACMIIKEIYLCIIFCFSFQNYNGTGNGVGNMSSYIFL